jgi:hypothetical protein
VRRRLILAALCIVVALLHLGLGQWWFDQRLGDGAGAAPPPIQVSFVREMPRAPPPRLSGAPPPAPRAAPSRMATRPAPAASAALTEVPEVVARAETVPADTAPSAPGPAPAASDAAPATDDDLPPSTQLLYTMTGNYRGPIQGQAEVSWLREGTHYQVRLEVRVPLLFSRSMMSDGVIGPAGLQPQRYDQETNVALQATRRDTLRVENGLVLLANGGMAVAPPGLQDTASQFVQMLMLFQWQPERLQVGRTLTFPLALPRRVANWTYEVAEQVDTPLSFGTLNTFHLRPAKDVVMAGELAVETWVAPELRYLPVRIVIRQSADVYLELLLKTPPLQAITNPPS